MFDGYFQDEKKEISFQLKNLTKGFLKCKASAGDEMIKFLEVSLIISFCYKRAINYSIVFYPVSL